jgi:predicted dehydrogenase
VTRVGIIGLGFGAAVHLPAFRSVPGVQVVALGGRRPEKARELAAANGIEVGGSIEDVLQLDLDAVSIALPPAAGAALIERVLDQGLAVLAEKPLAENTERALALARKAQGCTASVDFELAELDSFRAFKQQVERRAVRALRVGWRTRSYSHMRRRWSWKLDRARHGGVMNLLGSHVFYIAEWLVGPIAELEARFFHEHTQAFAPAGAEPAEERALIRASTRTGVQIDMELDNASGGSGQEWEAVLSDGRLVLAESGATGAFTLTDDATPGHAVAADVSEPGKDWRIEPLRRLASRFAFAARDKAVCLPDFAAGARVQLLLDAAKGSAARHSSVTVMPNERA